MEDTPQNSGPSTPPPESPPETPPSESPPETPPPSPQVSPNRPIMMVLSYLWILALIPLLVEKEDAEVQWHAKNGLLFLIAEIILWIALTILSLVPVIGTLLGCALVPLLWVVVLVIHIVAIVKALKGGRLLIPLVSDYVEQWK